MVELLRELYSGRFPNPWRSSFWRDLYDLLEKVIDAAATPAT